MEVWNEIWRKILIWNGRFFVWDGNGMEENCRYGIEKNRLSFHSIPCPGYDIIFLNNFSRYRLYHYAIRHDYNALNNDLLFCRVSRILQLL